MTEPGDTPELSPRVIRTLQDLLAFGDMAERLVARGRSEYDSDETLRLAAEAILHKIGEAVARLPTDFVETHPEVSWRAMKGARNVVAHQYEQVDYQIVWNALARRLPDEINLIRPILSG